MNDKLVPCDDASFAAQTITYNGTAGVTATFAPGPRAVLVWTTTDAHVKVGDGVTATTASMPIPARTMVKVNVPLGSGGPWRVSAIQTAAGGTGGSVYAQPLQD